MSREIKFRVWLNAGFYGSSNSHFHYFDIFDKPFINYLCDAKYLKENFDKKLVINGLLFQEPKIQQFTGLKDKNGKEIYEGDIVKTQGDTALSRGIFWTETSPCGVIFKRISQKSGKEITIHANALEIEVISNIHENPELLKN